MNFCEPLLPQCEVPRKMGEDPHNFLLTYGLGWDYIPMYYRTPLFQNGQGTITLAIFFLQIPLLKTHLKPTFYLVEAGF